MHTFQIPVRRFKDETFVTVQLSDESLVDNAFHGVDQRVNDATAGCKRENYESDDAWRNDIVEKVGKVVKRLNNGEFGSKRTREPSDPKKAEQRKVAKAMEKASPEALAEINKLLGL